MKKLFGMSKYLNSNQTITYENGNLKTLGLNMVDLFKTMPDCNKLWGSNDMLQESDNEDHVFQLGWNSMVKAKIENGGFKIIKVKTSDHSKSICDGRQVSSILTRAVETCTFLWLRKDNNIFVAHFENKKLFDYLQDIFLAQDLPNKQTSLIGKIEDEYLIDLLINSYDAEGEEEKEEKIDIPYNEIFISYCGDTDDYKKLINNLLGKEVNNNFVFKDNNKIIVFKRDIDKLDYYSHFEIGISLIENNKIEMFGDITHLEKDENGIIVENSISVLSNYFHNKDTLVGIM